MTVLITGGWGFLGRHLARALIQRGDSVVLFDAATPDPREVTRILGANAPVVTGDITQPGAVFDAIRGSGADRVIHAAAVVGVASTAHAPGRAVEVNILGALNVFEAASELGIKRLVDLSSIRSTATSPQTRSPRKSRAIRSPPTAYPSAPPNNSAATTPSSAASATWPPGFAGYTAPSFPASGCR